MQLKENTFILLLSGIVWAGGYILFWLTITTPLKEPLSIITLTACGIFMIIKFAPTSKYYVVISCKGIKRTRRK